MRERREECGDGEEEEEEEGEKKNTPHILHASPPI